MPRHRIHRLIDRAVLGREYPDVHRWMDEPYKILGKRHRVLRHSPLEVILRFYPDTDRVISGLLHIALDRIDSLARKGVKGVRR